MPFRHRNLRLYLWFQIFFNARFYYPVLAILFLDLGLTLDQFVMLNAIWAATILVAEVPSGALADILGRKTLVVVSAVLMLLEMGFLLFAPLDGGTLLFAICALNRVLSGLSEAAASGADQALAYDTLVEADEEDLWDDALATTMRWQSAAMIIAVVLGAACYDPSFLNQVFGTDLTQDQTLRFPLILCGLQALGALLTALRFEEKRPASGNRTRVKEVWAKTFEAARWVVTNKAALTIVTGGLVLDALVRNFATINSSYYRLISIPEKYYGLIAAAVSLLGLGIPFLAKRLARRTSLATTFSIGGAWILLSLVLLTPAWNYWGVVPAILLMGALSYTSFLVSRYLNQVTSSDQRATVLSVKGLFFNLSYGLISLLFSAAVAINRGSLSESQAFKATLAYQPYLFALLFVVWFLLRRPNKLETR